MTQARLLAGKLAVGSLAGLAGAFAMNCYQSRLARAGRKRPAETAATRAADEISESVTGAPVKRRHKQSADFLLHYLTGAIVGGVYGAIRKTVPMAAAGRGLLYGALVWLVADEMLVPALGLGPSPRRMNMKKMGLALSSHLVFGRTVDAILRWLSR